MRNRNKKINLPIGKMTGKFNDEDYGLGICSLHSDHQIWVFLNNPRFEIFIREAIDTYIDGYYLESFMKFYQALENFRRLFVEASLFNKDNSFSNILEISRGSLKNSTFLYGAYKFAYFEFFREIPDIKHAKHSLQINSKTNLTEYRNNVVHNGKYPSKQDIEKIGEIIIHYIQDIEFNFASNINIAQERGRLLRPGETPPKIHFKKGLAPIVPHYSASLLQHQISQLKKRGNNLEWITTNDIPAYLTLRNHYPGDKNPREITFDEYVERRRRNKSKDVFI